MSPLKFYRKCDGQSAGGLKIIQEGKKEAKKYLVAKVQNK